ncbi:MAG TPA: TIGR03936 family radical SAM-associated protein [Firmicutes bacterium]|nr:TIGR03936 family radical SAM-associated protein [Bacillota bacterium]
MSKLRLLFEKQGTACYISHLDLMRTFQRLFLRAGIFLKHSNGFHPHPIISIVLPLPVGQSSCCELLDFEIEQAVDLAALPALLNAGCPEGLRVLRAYEAVRPVKDLAFVQAEMDLIYDRGVPEGACAALRDLFSRQELMIQKKNKRKELVDVNVRPLLRQITFARQEGRVHVQAVVSAQNPGLNPALLASAVEANLPDYAPDFVTVRRTDVLDESGTSFR